MPSGKQRRGFTEEELAEARLVAEGYRVVDRNVRAGRYEIDRVAWDGPVLCFIEVRFRKNAHFGRAEATVGPRKRARIIRAALVYGRARFARWPMIRFDVVAVTGEGERREARLLRGAFDATGFV